MRALLTILAAFFFCFQVLACSCSFAWNDSFSRTAKNADFVALVKVLSFDEYLEEGIMGHEGKMPYAMTVEVIKKYKGEEQRRKIRILGDSGASCRPYLSVFEINEYYLISPSPLKETAGTDYCFFSCRTDYLKVEMNLRMAYGKYSMTRNEIDLEAFERNLKNLNRGFLVVGVITSLMILILVLRGNRKRKSGNRLRV